MGGFVLGLVEAAEGGVTLAPASAGGVESRTNSACAGAAAATKVCEGTNWESSPLRFRGTLSSTAMP
jgi:hypothetical protein